MQIIHTPDAPKPSGHYSHAIVHNGLVYVAGQVGFDPATGQVVEGGIEPQTERTLRNVEAILKAAGSGLEHILSMTVFITDNSLWAPVNATIARVMGAHRPSRAIIPINKLSQGLLIEIQAVAAQP